MPKQPAGTPAEYLVAEVVTYADLSQRLGFVLGFVERFLAEIVPHSIRWRVTYRPPQPGRARVSRHYKLAPGAADWGRLRERLAAARPTVVLFSAPIHTADGELTQTITLDVHVSSPERRDSNDPRGPDLPLDPREARYVSFATDTRAWPEGLTTGLQERLVGLLAELFSALDGACGYIDRRQPPPGEAWVDGSSPTAYEDRIGYLNPFFRQRLWCDVRGAFWGNLLSRQHVARLGGEDHVLAEAPCAVARPLAAGSGRGEGGGAVYLQLTEQLNAPIPEPHYRQLEAFLAPILLSERDQWGYVILAPALAQSLAAGARAILAGSVARVSALPDGSLLLQYAERAGWPAAYHALTSVGATAAPYCTIPQLRSRYLADDATVYAAPGTMGRGPASRGTLPAIIVYPYILTDRIRLEVTFADPPAPEAVAEFSRVVERWQQLRYAAAPEPAVIASCSAPALSDGRLTWQADLAPVGQDAYFQLVLLLDEFSRTSARLRQVEVRPADT